MVLQLVQVNIKAADDASLGRFWADALGWGMASEGPGVTNLEPIGFDWPHPSAVCVDLVAVPDPETVHYRAHLDLATTSSQHHAELVRRLRRLGATSADIGQGDVPWTVLADPDGNVFCVLEPRPVYADTGPIAAVVLSCDDPGEMARFWGEAIGWTVHERSVDLVRLRAPEGVGPYLELVRAGETIAPSRMHLDLLPVESEETVEVDRLRALGATSVDVGQGEVPWECLADPEGNDFCVLAAR